jgi:hypothetical protein
MKAVILLIAIYALIAGMFMYISAGNKDSSEIGELPVIEVVGKKGSRP